MTTAAALTSALADRYRVERELGQGGMATVYLAHDLRHDRDVAIKVLHPDLGAALGAERFLAEIRTTAKLQHPHILALLDSGAAASLLYYVMPYVTGETLRVRLERERQLPLADAPRVAREVADALSAAHALGIIHRDIKPENILLQGGHTLVAGEWEVYNWLPDDRLVGVSWKRRRLEIAHIDRSGRLDTLFTDATFARVSPDGRWLAYSNWDLTRIWLEPFPRTGRRWEVVSGNNEEPHWLSPTEFFYTAYDPSMGFDRVKLDPTRRTPSSSAAAGSTPPGWWRPRALLHANAEWTRCLCAGLARRTSSLPARDPELGGALETRG